jgi:hypothetical protein
MVIVQRNEISRSRILSVLTLVLSAIVLASAISGFSQRSEFAQFLSFAAGCIAVAAIIMSILQLYAHPRRSQVILFHRDDEIIIATNALHEGFKLRFLRDILGENMFAFSDEERARWKGLEADGFYATLYVRNVRKVILLRLCTMIFDDVFLADRNDRWEHHDSSSTPEPTYSKREMPPLKSFKTS